MVDELNVRIPAGVTLKVQLDRVLSFILPCKRRNEIKAMYKSDPRSALAQYILKREATVEQLFAMDLPVGLAEKKNATSRVRYQNIKDDPVFKEQKHLNNQKRPKKNKSGHSNSSQVTTESNDSIISSQHASVTIPTEVDSGVAPEQICESNPSYYEPEIADPGSPGGAIAPISPPEIADPGSPGGAIAPISPPEIADPGSPGDGIVPIFPEFDREIVDDPNFSDSERYIGSSEDEVTDSDEEPYCYGASVRCSGHKRDQLQLIIPHPRVMQCSSEERDDFNPKIPSPEFFFEKEDLWKRLREHCEEIVKGSKDDPDESFTSPDVRAAAIEAQKKKDAVFHLKLSRSDITSRENFDEFAIPCIEIFKEYWRFLYQSSDRNKNYPKKASVAGGRKRRACSRPEETARFRTIVLEGEPSQVVPENEPLDIDDITSQSQYSDVRRGNLKSYTLSYMCDYERQHRAHAKKRGEKKSGFIAQCCGKLTIKYVIPTHTLGIRHEHRPHKCEQSKLGFSAQAVKNLVEVIRENRGLEVIPGAVMRSWVSVAIHPKAGQMAFDLQKTALKEHYWLHQADIISAIMFVESIRSRYGLFIFYNKSKTGIAIFNKDIIAKGAAATTALSVDATYGTNQHNADLLFANGCIDRTGVVMAMMWILDTKHLREYLQKENYGILTEEKPLFQCPMAAQIDAEVAKVDSFKKDKLSDLTASFLCLLSRGAHPSPHEVLRHGMHSPPYKSMEHRNPIVGDEMLAAHEFPGLQSVEILLTDKHQATIKAFNYAIPYASTHLCLWHVKDAIRRHIIHAQFFKQYFKNLKDGKTVLPPIFEKYVPFMTSRALIPHSADECAQHLGVSQEQAELCILHSTKLEDHYDPPFVLFNKKDKSRLRTKATLLRMISRHSRTHPTIPRGFTGIGEQYNSCRHYSPDVLESLCLEEMIAFCASRGLYSNMMYLWTSWYEPSTFRQWTMVFLKEYLNDTTNMIAEGNHSKVKKKVRATGNTRLDEFLYLFDKLLYKDYYRRAVILSKAVLTGVYHDIHKELRISWSERRISKLNNMIRDKNPKHVVLSVYRNDLEKFGTDPVNFVCGCPEYQHHNMHLCGHIINAISADYLISFRLEGLKHSVRSSNTIPYFTNHFNGGTSTKATWHMQYAKSYVEFYKKEGRALLNSLHPSYPQPEMNSNAVEEDSPAVPGFVDSLPKESQSQHKENECANEEEHVQPQSSESILTAELAHSFFQDPNLMEILRSAHPKSQIGTVLKRLNEKMLKLISAVVGEEEINFGMVDRPTISQRWNYPELKKTAAHISSDVRRKIILARRGKQSIDSGDFCPEQRNLARRIEGVAKKIDRGAPL